MDPGTLGYSKSPAIINQMALSRIVALLFIMHGIHMVAYT